MLHLDSHVIRQCWKFTMHRFHQRNGVAHSVEEIGITKRDVLSSCNYLLPDIAKHHLSIHNAKYPFVHRHYRAMPAEMFTSSASFRVAHNTMLPGRKHQVRVGTQRRQPRTV